MSSIEKTIQKFEKLRNEINNARSGDYQVNREIFNELKNLLIEYGFDIDIITIDLNDKFFKPPQDFERILGDPNEKFKDHQGRLAALCTKAIRDLSEQLSTANKNINEPDKNVIFKTKIEYPPTSWKLIRNTLFWTIFIGILSLSCFGFYYLGQNSKEKENADLVVQNSERKSEIKELKNELERISTSLSSCIEENRKLKIGNRIEQIKN